MEYHVDIETVMVPDDTDEEGWLRWAGIALKYEGVDAALYVLGAYLALNPERAEALDEEWSNRESASDRQPRLDEPDDSVDSPG